jgi:hypothetical protein
MTTTKEKNVLTVEEWDELVALKNAINYNPASVHFEKMERFTELMVKSLEGKGDRPVEQVHTPITNGI